MANSKSSKKKVNPDSTGFTIEGGGFGEIHLHKGSPADKAPKTVIHHRTKARAGEVIQANNEAVKTSTVRIPDVHDDATIVKDFARGINDIRQRIDMINRDDTMGQYTVDFVGESVLSSKLLDIARELHRTVYTFADRVSKSSSHFFSDSFKKRMTAEVETLAAMKGDDVRDIRYLFMNFNVFMTMAKLPEIENGVLASYDDFNSLLAAYKFDQFFDAGVDVYNSRNSMHTAKEDGRGACDVNLGFYLHILPVTPALKRTLTNLGVSDNLINQLGQWIVNKDCAPDEDEHLSSKYYVNKDLLTAGSNAWVDYTGPRIYDPIVEDLIRFIQHFQVKASVVNSMDYPDLTKAGDKYTGKVKVNMFNPDLAIKFWMMGALNATYKVLVEDGLGAMARVNDSLSRNLADYKPANIADVASLILDTVDDSFDSLAKECKRQFNNLGPNILYNQVVYDFLKKRFAPIITTFKVRDSARFINNQAIEEREYRINMIPELVLPINPYDSQTAWYESEEGKYHELPTSEHMKDDRNPFFTTEKLLLVEVDRNVLKYKESTILHFDNFLSYAAYVISNNDTYNVHAFGSHISHNDARKAAELSLKLHSAPASEFVKVGRVAAVDVADSLHGTSWAGPWVAKVTETATGSNTDSIMVQDLHSSFINRDVVLHYAGNQEFINPFIGKVVSEEGCETLDSCGLMYRLAIRHTNPMAFRMAVTLPWFALNTTFSSKQMARTNKLRAFTNNCLKNADVTLGLTSSESLGAPVFKGSSADVGGLKPSDFFRYTWMIDANNSMGVIDNCTYGNFATIPTYDTKKKLSGAYLVNVNKSQSITGDMIAKGIAPVDGSFTAFGGSYQVDKCKRIKNGICCTAGTFGSDEMSAVVTAAKRGFFSDPGSYIRIQLPALKIPYSFSASNGYPRYLVREREVNTFTVAVDVSAYAAWKYNKDSKGNVVFEAPTAASPATTADVILGSRESINNSVEAWKDAIWETIWNNTHSDAESKTLALRPTYDAITSIFRPFDPADVYSSENEAKMNGITFDAAKSCKGELLDLTRWSTTGYFIIASPAFDGSSVSTDLDACVLDADQFCAAHGNGLITSCCDYASERVTLSLMKALGIPAATQQTITSVIYHRTMPHDLIVRVSSYFVKLPKREKVYTSTISKVAQVNGSLQNVYLTNEPAPKYD